MPSLTQVVTLSMGPPPPDGRYVFVIRSRVKSKPLSNEVEDCDDGGDSLRPKRDDDCCFQRASMHAAHTQPTSPVCSFVRRCKFDSPRRRTFAESSSREPSSLSATPLRL